MTVLVNCLVIINTVLPNGILMNTTGGNMKLTLNQYETRYAEFINKMYEHAENNCPSLKHLNFILETSPVGYNVEVSKGFGEDEGTYKVAFKLSDNLEEVRQSFAMGLAMMIYDSINGETDFNSLNDTEKNEFINIYTTLLYEGE